MVHILNDPTMSLKYGNFFYKYEKILQYNKIEYKYIDVEDVFTANPEFLLLRWRKPDDHFQMTNTLVPVLEKIGVKCFPDSLTSWIFEDKVRQDYLLKAFDLPIIRSNIFWSKDIALNWVNSAKYPQVFKLKGGAGSKNVLLVKDKVSAIRLIKRMFSKGFNPSKFSVKGSTTTKDFKLFKELKRTAGKLYRLYKGQDVNAYWQTHKNYVLFQQFMPNNNFDTRVTIIGNHAFSFRRMNRKNDFRSSGSGIIDYDNTKIDLNHVKTAFKISEEFNFISMAYDFLYDKDGNSVICEMSYTFADWAINKCNGYWDKDFTWHEGHFWPQYIQLKEWLKVSELEQPNLE